MTILDAPSSPPQPPAPSPASPITESWLIARALTRAGFPCIVTIAQDPSAQTTPSPLYALHLARPLPIDSLLHALSTLKSQNANPPALLLMNHSPRTHSYREVLHLNDQQNVIAIQRKFHPHDISDAPLQLAGVAWKITAPFRHLHSPTPSHCWSTLHKLLRRFPNHTLPRITLTLPAEPPSNYFIGPKTRRRPLYALLKRAFDILFASFALLVTLPICLAVALLIKLHDKGPIFFIHRREGQHAKPFGCLKFRTMTQNADALQAKLRHSNQLDGPQFKIANDPRITPIGRFLRKSNIDELPQFLNVLAGHMSVVGPRPSPFNENQLCPAWREARLSIKPGITGLWQISRSKNRGNSDFQEWILYDTQYVDRQNLLLDLRIILLTLKQLLGQGQ